MSNSSRVTRSRRAKNALSIAFKLASKSLAGLFASTSLTRPCSCSSHCEVAISPSADRSESTPANAKNICIDTVHVARAPHHDGAQNPSRIRLCLVNCLNDRTKMTGIGNAKGLGLFLSTLEKRKHQMHVRSFLAAGLFATASTAALAEDPPYTLTANVSLVSD